MFTWPENILPLPSHNFSVDAEFSNIRSKMDSGRARQRPRFSRELELANVVFELNKMEFQYFKGVWVHEINRGNDWFTMRLPVANGEDLALSEIRFASDYKATHRPVGNWDVSATIEFKESAKLSPDILAVLISESPNIDGFNSAAENLTSEVSHFNASHSFQNP